MTIPPYTPPPWLQPVVASSTAIRIRKKNGGRIVTIEPHLFDPEQHERLDEDKPGTTRVRAAQQPAAEPSRYSEVELPRLSVDVLKKLPEFKLVKVAWRTKQELVNAIISVRRIMLGDAEDD